MLHMSGSSASYCIWSCITLLHIVSSPVIAYGQLLHIVSSTGIADCSYCRLSVITYGQLLHIVSSTFIHCILSVACYRQLALQSVYNGKSNLIFARVICSLRNHTPLQVQPFQNGQVNRTSQLQHTATHCNTLQYTIAHCNTHGQVNLTSQLQHTATHYYTLQHTWSGEAHKSAATLQHTTTHRNTL